MPSAFQSSSSSMSRGKDKRDSLNLALSLDSFNALRAFRICLAIHLS